MENPKHAYTLAAVHFSQEEVKQLQAFLPDTEIRTYENGFSFFSQWLVDTSAVQAVFSKGRHNGPNGISLLRQLQAHESQTSLPFMLQ